MLFKNATQSPTQRMPKSDLERFLEVARQAANIGGTILLELLGRVSPKEKGPGDLVTEADLLSQRAIEKRIRQDFPEHFFLGEESTSHVDWKKGLCWIVDPLDGTMNFVHRLPSFSVSIGLLLDGVPIVGVVFDPILKEVFTAIAGQGAKLNGLAIRKSNCVSLDQALLVSSFPSRVPPDSPELIRFNRVVQRATMRRLGSAALNLCYVGCGRLDGYWASTLSLWDVAAGILIAHEAGAKTTHLGGGELDLSDPQILATSTDELQAQLLPLLDVSTV